MSLSREGVQVVVDFTATWCGPCQLIAPFFAELAADHPSALFVKVDVDELARLKKTAGVAKLPTFQVYRDGAKVDEVVGARPAVLDALVAEHCG